MILNDVSNVHFKNKLASPCCYPNLVVIDKARPGEGKTLYWLFWKKQHLDLICMRAHLIEFPQAVKEMPMCLGADLGQRGSPNMPTLHSSTPALPPAGTRQMFQTRMKHNTTERGNTHIGRNGRHKGEYTAWTELWIESNCCNATWIKLWMSRIGNGESNRESYRIANRAVNRSRLRIEKRIANRSDGVCFRIVAYRGESQGFQYNTPIRIGWPRRALCKCFGCWGGCCITAWSVAAWRF